MPPLGLQHRCLLPPVCASILYDDCCVIHARSGTLGHVCTQRHHCMISKALSVRARFTCAGVDGVAQWHFNPLRKPAVAS